MCRTYRWYRYKALHTITYHHWPQPGIEADSQLFSFFTLRIKILTTTQGIGTGLKTNLAMNCLNGFTSLSSVVCVIVIVIVHSTSGDKVLCMTLKRTIIYSEK